MENLDILIKELRQKQRWTQEELAARVGVSLSTVQRWEKHGGQPVLLARRELQRLFREAKINELGV